jgi:hypothetical protein
MKIARAGGVFTTKALRKENREEFKIRDISSFVSLWLILCDSTKVGWVEQSETKHKDCSNN